MSQGSPKCFFFRRLKKTPKGEATPQKFHAKARGKRTFFVAIWGLFSEMADSFRESRSKSIGTYDSFCNMEESSLGLVPESAGRMEETMET